MECRSVYVGNNIIKKHKLAIIIPVPDSVHCTNVNCSDPVHIENTTRFYIAILGSLHDAISSVFQQAGNGRGWNYSNYSSSLVYTSTIRKNWRRLLYVYG